jgi:hypothetical protein
MLLVQRVPSLIVKPEVRNLSQKVATELAQRAAARLIRELFLSSDPLIPDLTPIEQNGHSKNGKSPVKEPLSLPPSR